MRGSLHLKRDPACNTSGIRLTHIPVAAVSTFESPAGKRDLALFMSLIILVDLLILLCFDDQINEEKDH